MANFSTNQARHLYFMGDFKSTVAAVTGSDGVAGDLALGSSVYPGATGETHPLSTIYFVLRNGDGKIIRSDNINIGCIDYINMKSADELATTLLAHTVTLNDGSATDKNGGDSVVIADVQGKTVTINVMARQFLDYDPRSALGISASYKVASNGSASDLYKNLALNLAKSIPNFAGDEDYPIFKVFVKTSNGTTEVKKSTASSSLNGSYTGIVIVEAGQANIYRRGLIPNEPMPLDVSFDCSDDDVKLWGIDKVAASEITGNTVIGDGYKIADLEYFCVGERGDIFRMKNWPNNWEYTYQVNPASTYDMLTIQYHWKGHAENVQKSPKTIHIVGSSADISDLYDAVLVAAGLSDDSGSGSGA